jgi:hypothetical protein
MKSAYNSERSLSLNYSLTRLLLLSLFTLVCAKLGRSTFILKVCTIDSFEFFLRKIKKKPKIKKEYEKSIYKLLIIKDPIEFFQNLRQNITLREFSFPITKVFILNF